MSSIALRTVIRQAPRVPGVVMRHPYVIVSVAAFAAAAWTVAASV